MKLWRRICLELDVLWASRPKRCYACRRFFPRGDFWNPWGPGKGPGLCCSQECCEKAVPGSTDWVKDWPG
jgi:hypothetical protein